MANIGQQTTYISTYTTIVSRTGLLPFLRSDGGEGVWSIELTFLSQLRHLGTGVGMIITLHVYIVIIIYSTSVLKTKIANEQMIHNFTKNCVYFEDEAERSCILPTDQIWEVS